MQPLATRLAKLTAITTKTRREYEQAHKPLHASQRTSFANNLETTAQALYQAMPKEQALLADTGSGLGTPTIIANMLGYQAIGIEQDTKLLEYANKASKLAQQNNLLKTPPTFVQGDFLTNQPYQKAKTAFNEIDVFYNFTLQEPATKLIKQFSEQAKPGARAIVVLAPENYDKLLRERPNLQHLQTNSALGYPTYHIIQKNT